MDPARRAGRVLPGRRSRARPSRAASPGPMPSPSCQLLCEEVEQQSVAPDAIRIAPILAHHADGAEAHLLVAADRALVVRRRVDRRGGGARDRRSGGAPSFALRRCRGPRPWKAAEEEVDPGVSEIWLVLLVVLDQPGRLPLDDDREDGRRRGSSPRAFLPRSSAVARATSGPPQARSPISTIRGTSASTSGRSTTRSPRNSMTVL